MPYEPSEQFEALHALLAELPDSDGVCRLNCAIPEYPSFFPGGRGYQGPTFPQTPIMLIGHNFDTEIGFKASLSRGFEDSSMKTWVHLRQRYLHAGGILEQDCFFTNLYLGAIASKQDSGEKRSRQSNTGPFKCSREYKDSCIQTLRKQVEISRPKVIALLGSKVLKPFSQSFPSFAPNCGSNLTKTQAKQPSEGYSLQLLADLRVQVICLVHPANPRSDESKFAQGALLGAAVRAAIRHL